jgi:hypothetical protein
VARAGRTPTTGHRRSRKVCRQLRLHSEGFTAWPGVGAQVDGQTNGLGNHRLMEYGLCSAALEVKLAVHEAQGCWSRCSYEQTVLALLPLAGKPVRAMRCLSYANRRARGDALATTTPRQQPSRKRATMQGRSVARQARCHWRKPCSSVIFHDHRGWATASTMRRPWRQTTIPA